ncbi:MAG: beta-ketoacyl synthase [Terriglobales bacterium]
MTTPRRVAVTGLGLICALGNTVAESWDALRQGRCGIRPIESADTSTLKFRNGAEVRAYDPLQHFDPSRLELLDRFAQLLIVATREAVTDSGLSFAGELGERTAIVTGTGAGGFITADAQFSRAASNCRMHPFAVPRIMASAGASYISMEFGISGPTYTVSTACSSANHAIGQAFWMVRSGQVDAAIAGGSEAPFSLGILRGWDALRVVSPDTCRPFARERRGMVLGEGAGVLVLEPLDAARTRGAHVYAEIAGFGMSSDAHHITQPSLDGPVRAMRAALRDAGIEPARIGYINAHGTGTPLNDPLEARAIRAVYGDSADHVAVSSTKSAHGHALGAAGAIEAVATVLALHDRLLPPTVNFTERDPECDLDIIANQARPAAVEYAMSNSFAFGGLNAVLTLRAIW